MIRATFILVLLVQVIAWSLALLFVYALIFNPELIGGTVARVIVGFQQVFATREIGGAQ